MRQPRSSWAEWEARLDRLGRGLLAWWVWPATLVATGALVFLGSWSFIPDGDGQVAFLGWWSFPACSTLVSTGLPCSQCGMTRSFVWAARGQVAMAFSYSPAGLALWLWLLASAGVGGARLGRRDARVLEISWRVLGVLVLGWVGLFVLAQQLRLQGVLGFPGG